jgi:hypothetical protein
LALAESDFQNRTAIRSSGRAILSRYAVSEGVLPSEHLQSGMSTVQRAGAGFVRALHFQGYCRIVLVGQTAS